MQIHFMLFDQFNHPLEMNESNEYIQAFIKQHATVSGRASGAGANRRAGNQLNVSIVEDSWKWGAVGQGTKYVNSVSAWVIDGLDARLDTPFMHLW